MTAKRGSVRWGPGAPQYLEFGHRRRRRKHAREPEKEGPVSKEKEGMGLGKAKNGVVNGNRSHRSLKRNGS